MLYKRECRPRNECCGGMSEGYLVVYRALHARELGAAHPADSAYVVGMARWKDAGSGEWKVGWRMRSARVLVSRVLLVLLTLSTLAARSYPLGVAAHAALQCLLGIGV